MQSGRETSNLNKRRHTVQAIVRRPFWVPASNYYVLTVAVATAFFFLTWGVLHDEGEETPWVSSGVGASIILGGAVVLRAILLRRARERYKYEPGLAQTYSGVHPQFRGPRNAKRVSLEQNAAILAEIKQKSNAAKILGKFFLKGRRSAADFHRYHLMQWAEIEARSFTGEANTRVALEDKIEAANEALEVVDFALKYYPAEQSLIDSRSALEEMTVSIKVADLVERAERAAFKGDFQEALSLYRDALFDLGRNNVHTEDRQQAAIHINAEIDRIRLLETGK